MTIPILPGPWGFLANAGGALGAYGQGVSQRNVYEQQQAQQNAQLLATLIAKGLVDPGAMATGANQQMFQTAGLPGIQPGQVRTPKEMQLAKGFEQESGLLQPGSMLSQMNYGVPTQAAADVLAGQGALGRQQFQAREGMTVPQAQVAEKLPSAAAAPVIQKAQTTAAQAQNYQEEFNKDLWQSVRSRHAGDKEFSKIADYAAVHGLGWLTSMNDMWARLGSERAAQNTAQIRLVTTIHNRASQEYLQYKSNWDKGLQAEIDRQLGPLTPGADLKGPERDRKMNEIIKSYTDRNEPLTIDHFIKNATISYQSNDAEYDAAVRDIMGGVAAQTQDRMAQLKELYRRKVYTDADIDNDPGLTPEQRTEIKSAGTTGAVGVKTGVSKFGAPKPQ